MLSAVPDGDGMGVAFLGIHLGVVNHVDLDGWAYGFLLAGLLLDALAFALIISGLKKMNKREDAP